MAEEKKIEFSVERIGDKTVFRLDAELVRVHPGCCCCCNTVFDAIRAAQSAETPASVKK